MPRRLPEPDLTLILDALPATARAFVEEAEIAIGIPPGTWPAIPPLRELVIVLAVLALAERERGSRSDALARAYDRLGVEDDTERSSRPSDSLFARLRRWRAAANKDVRSAGAA